jgi:sugar phosphate permease
MRTHVHYAWKVAAVAFLALVMSSGFRSVTGVLLIPLHEEFAWSHETIGLAVSLNLLCFGLGAPFAAALVERFGVRRVVGAALTAIAISSLLTIEMTETWQLFVLWGLVNGCATGAVSVPLAAIIANRWFEQRRGLVTGLMTASYASGQLIFLPALAWLAEFDWRYAALAVAAVALLLVLPAVVVVMRDRPEDVNLRPYGAHESWEAPSRTSARAFGAALTALADAAQTRVFWLLAGTFLRLRRDDERPDLDALDPGCARPRDHASHRCRTARAHRRLRHRRHDGFGLADGPIRPAQAASRLLRAPRRIAARAAARLRFDERGDARIRRRVRP